MITFIKNLFRKGKPKTGPETPILDHFFPSKDMEGSNKVSLRSLNGRSVFVVSPELYRQLIENPKLLDRIWHSHPLNKESTGDDKRPD